MKIKGFPEYLQKIYEHASLTRLKKYRQAVDGYLQDSRSELKKDKAMLQFIDKEIVKRNSINED